MSAVSLRVHRCSVLGALALAALLPAAASAASTPGNPQVLHISSNGVATAIAGGAPWAHLGGIAVGSSGTVYVSNQDNAGQSTPGTGLYASTGPLASSGLQAFGPIVTTAPTAIPTGLVASGSTLYSLDEDRVIAIGAGAPYAQTVLSSGQVYDTYGANPAWGTIAGGTLYTTSWSSCDSAEGGAAIVVAVNLTTGVQTLVKTFGCAQLGGIAAEPSGTLLVAVPGTSTSDGGPAAPAKIVRLNPVTGAVTTVSTGGLLSTPQGLASANGSTLYVADTTSGIIAINTSSGRQTAFSKPGGKSPLGGANGIAVSPAGGLYVSEAGIAPQLTSAAAKSPQTFSTRGIPFSAGCNVTCTLAYSASFVIPGGDSFAQDAAFHGLGSKRTLVIKLPEQVNNRIASSLRKRHVVTLTLTLTPQDPTTGNPGTSKKLKVLLRR